jgi:putative endonuclease
MEGQPAVYILASKYNGTLYIGVTNDLVRRVWEHKNNVVPGFTRKYQVHRLVYFECFEEMYEAISREKQLKAGSRRKKIALIESVNPEWKDLYFEICQ